jgi:hypothetical protein
MSKILHHFLGINKKYLIILLLPAVLTASDYYFCPFVSVMGVFIRLFAGGEYQVSVVTFPY